MDRRKNYIAQGFDIPGGRIEVVLTTDKPAETRHYQLMKETVQAIDRWSSLQPDEGGKVLQQTRPKMNTTNSRIPLIRGETKGG